MLFFLTIKQLLGSISSTEALLHLKNKTGFGTDFVGDMLVVGTVRYAGFWQPLSSGSVSSSPSIQRVQSLGRAGSSRSGLPRVRLILENKHFKGEADPRNSIKLGSGFSGGGADGLWMGWCIWLVLQVQEEPCWPGSAHTPRDHGITD